MGSVGQGGQKLLTGNIQVEWVTAAGTHWVPGFTLIGSYVVPCDIEYREGPVVLGLLQLGTVLDALTVDQPQVGGVLNLRFTREHYRVLVLHGVRVVACDVGFG